MKELKYSKLFIIYIVGITLLIGCSLIFNILDEKQSAYNYAKAEAIASYNKDLLYRRWVTMQGGVYVPITESTTPNPYLEFLPERDIVTTSGKQLTLVNPAYMTRLVFLIADGQYGVKGHITSLKPIRPENKADNWEVNALQKFENGDTEYCNVDKINGMKYLRFMHSMKVEDRCLKCHAKQDYKIGDVRGGISVSVPMDKYNQIALSSIIKLSITHFSIYVIVVILSFLGYKRLLKEKNEKNLLLKKIAESEKAYKDVVETSTDLITIVDTHGKLLFVNHASKIFWGVSPEESIGRLAFDFIHPDDVKFTLKKFSEWILQENNYYYFENRQISKNGKILNVSWNINIERNNKEIVKITSLARNITEQKCYEEQIQKQNDELVKLNTDKDRFLSILAHDLRSPFNTILGFTRLLLKNSRKYDIDKIESFAYQINQSSQKTFNLLEDLLLWANSQSGKIGYEPQILNLKIICDEIFEILKLNIEEKNITINNFLEASTNVKADKNMLKTILRNIISNAIKFTKNGGEIAISAQQNQTEIIISISDNGIGMTQDTMSKLFDITKPFSTAGTENESGTGFGLFLCKEFVEKHDGKIGVESEIDKGSRFYFTLPEFETKS